MAILRYEFTNFTQESFTGRYGGVNYTFAPGETRPFDPDKHYMLKLMAKQLADRELVKRIHSVGRDPKDMETWGKSLDEAGRPFQITPDMRLEIMRNAIGALADEPVPVPESETAEAGSTKEANEDISTLKKDLAEMKEMVASLTNALASKTQLRTEHRGDAEPNTEVAPQSATEPISMTREVLEEMAQEANIKNTETMTKEELIRAVNQSQV